MEKKLVVVTNSKVNRYIPNDIAFSILSKLPLKSLKRFQCVQKSWSLLFENHRFMNMFHINLFSNSHCCSYYDGASLFLRVFGHHRYNLYSLSGKRFENKVNLDCSYPFVNQFGIFGFGSINGTLCFHIDNNCGKIILWNPTTQEINLIPPSMVESAESSFPDVAKDFASLHVMHYLHGFGYDYLIDDYKLIRYVSVLGVRLDCEDLSLPLLEDISLHSPWEIYSIRSNSWRKLDVDHMPYSLHYLEGTQVFLDGVCHWLCEEDSPAGPCLVSFYLSNEVFFITPIPSNDDYFVFEAWWNLVVLNESVALISYHKDMTFHISILGEFGIEKSWTKLLITEPLSCVDRPIGVGTKGEIFFIRKDEELVWLDLSTQMVEELGFKEESYRIIIYKESNLPIAGISN